MSNLAGDLEVLAGGDDEYSGRASRPGYLRVAVGALVLDAIDAYSKKLEAGERAGPDSGRALTYAPGENDGLNGGE